MRTAAKLKRSHPQTEVSNLEKQNREKVCRGRYGDNHCSWPTEGLVEKDAAPDLMVSFQITNSQSGPFAQLFALADAKKGLDDLRYSAGGLESTTTSRTSSRNVGAPPCAMFVVVWPNYWTRKRQRLELEGLLQGFYTKTKCKVQNKNSQWTSTLYYEQDGPALQFLPQTAAHWRLLPFSSNPSRKHSAYCLK